MFKIVMVTCYTLQTYLFEVLTERFNGCPGLMEEKTELKTLAVIHVAWSGPPSDVISHVSFGKLTRTHAHSLCK